MDRGRRDRWFHAPPADGWRPIAIPSAWQSVVAEDEADVCWYRRELPPLEPAADGAPRRHWLHFAAAATDTRAWLGGQAVGEATGDWAPFEFEVTGALIVNRGASGPPADLLIRIDRRRPDPPRWIDGAPVNSGHITKGFHDVVSMQHAGLWQSVTLRTTGPAAIRPGGVIIRPDADTGAVVITIDLHDEAPGARATVEVTAPDTSAPSGAGLHPAGGDFTNASATLRLHIPNLQLWSPETPNLYTAHIKVEAGGQLSDETTIRFGFRKVTTGGENNTRILLNGQPIFLRGMLDWGHEPDTGAPAPSPDEVRARFARLRDMGFNLVCICMWYSPQWFYDIADETGMLIWQEHPTWKGPMRPELNAAYQAQFERFFRQDVNHPSVIIVSGSCEHERIDPDLAAWWWRRARELMPDRLLQVQTAFLEWGESDRSDLHDEHTYETMGRWVQYQSDLEAELATRSPRPFVMGESVLYPNFPPVREIRERYGNELPWWAPLRMHELEAFERAVEDRFGPETLARFRADNRAWHLAGRKRQMEVFRQRASHAGLVMNHLRDVPLCPCGFQDDFGRWLFAPEDTRPWLAEACLLLRTPGDLRGYQGGQHLPCEIGLSNFGGRPLRGSARIEIEAAASRRSFEAPVEAKPGEVAFAPITVHLPAVDTPTRLHISAAVDGAEPNTWILWLFPPRSDPRSATSSVPSVVQIAEVEPFTESERALTFEERRYSSGWGLSRMTWRPRLPDPAAFLPGVRQWGGSGARAGARAVLTTRLTPDLCDHLESGGRVMLLATNAAGSPPAKTVNMWGQSPLLPAAGPLRDDDGATRDWVFDLLDHDLTRRHMRAVPTGELGLAGSVDPFIRLVYLHDRPRGVPVYDSVFTARVGAGILLVSTLDHAEPAGLALLDGLITWLAGADLPESQLDSAIVRGWTAGKGAK
jgi:hypothetical protein